MNHDFDLADPAFTANPYPSYAAMREQGPVWQQPDDLCFVSHYDAVVEVLRDPDRFSSRAMQLPGMKGDSALIGMDPPTHSEQRNIVNRGFTPRRIALLEPRIRKRVDELFGAFEARGEVELIRELATPLAVTVIAELLGLDPTRHADFKRWTDQTIVGATGGGVSEEQVERSLAEMHAYLGEVIDARRAEPADDLISALVHAGEDEGVLDAAQVLGFAQLLVAAGSETTTNWIGNAIVALLEHPETLAAMRDDPARVPAVLEETLRWDSPVQLVMRFVTRDLELAGVEIARGQRLMVLLGSANRDPAAFSQPDAFDIGRSARGHVGFGLGNHFCLGASLARLEARVALETVLERMPGLTLATDEVKRHGSFLVRGPRQLPLHFEGLKRRRGPSRSAR